MVAQRRASGGLESEVLTRLWGAEKPLTVGELVVDLGGALAYNTVQTILIRLLAKQAVRRELVGRAHAYTPVLDDAGLLAHRMREEVRLREDRDAVLAHFIASLDTREREIVQGVLGLS